MSDPLSLVDKKHIVMLKNRAHPTYPGVLEAAMKQGLLELSVKVVQAPTTENGGLAICEALARFPGAEGRDRIFQDVGDCDGSNCTSHIAAHRVRMASTRAKGRALRDALGIGIALVEEMAGDDEREDAMARPTANGKPPGATQGGVQQAAADEHSAAAGTGARLVANRLDGPPRCSQEDCGVEISPAEANASAQRGWPPYCKTHGYERNMREKAERAERGTDPLTRV